MTDLRNKLRPFVESLVAKLVDEAVTHIETTARDRLRAALSPEPITHRDPKPVKPRRAKPARKRARRKPATIAKPRPAAMPVKARIDPPTPKQAAPAPNAAPTREATAITSKGALRQRAVMRCGLCGEVGFRREGCGKTHNVRLGAPEIEKAPIPRTATPAQLSVLERARLRELGAG
jgi:hypothetical protein